MMTSPKGAIVETANAAPRPERSECRKQACPVPGFNESCEHFGRRAKNVAANGR
jgi:hypothetical protein